MSVKPVASRFAELNAQNQEAANDPPGMRSRPQPIFALIFNALL
jgi:hypothetical protein